MNFLCRSSYDEMEFVWVSNHWDIHLTGLCYYQNKLCCFKIIDPEVENLKYNIFSLSIREKLSWLYRKKKFEICIGKIWTYPDYERGVVYKPRKPKWLNNLLLYWQYKRKYNHI